MVIGEAAKRVSEKFKQSHSEILWKAIIGQRNILAHEYGEILAEGIWLVANVNEFSRIKGLRLEDWEVNKEEI